MLICMLSEAENLGKLTIQKNMPKELQRFTKVEAVAAVSIYEMFLPSVKP